MFELTPISEKDLKQVLNWRNLKHIRENMLNNRMITWEEHCNWFQNLQSKDNGLVFIFRINGEAVGIVSFVDINLENHNCNWGFYIGNRTAPKGSGTLMAHYAIEYIFKKYQLHKINSEVIDFNKISLNFHKKLSFEETGFLKENLYRENSYHDLILFSLFKRQWDNVKNEIYSNALKKLKGDF